jgi:hypothetical protein
MKLFLFFYLSLTLPIAAQATGIIDKNYLKLEQPNKEHYGTYLAFVAAAKEGNTKALQSLFEYYKKSLDPYYRTKLTYDLFGVFTQKPDFYVKTSDQYFKAEICAYTTLMTESEENKMYQLEYVLTEAKLKNHLTRFQNFGKKSKDDLRTLQRACF